MKISFIKSFIVAALVVLLTGCATTSTTALNPNVKQSIHTIAIDPNVKMPEKVSYMGPGMGYGVLLGPIGGAVAGAASESEQTKLQAIIDQNNIHVDSLVKQQFVSEINSTSQYRVADQSTANATLKIEVENYGLSIPNGFSTVVTPIMVVNAYLWQNGQLVWKSGHLIGPLGGDLPKYKPDAIVNNPGLLTQVWDMAAHEAAQNVVSTLK